MYVPAMLIRSGSLLLLRAVFSNKLAAASTVARHPPTRTALLAAVVKLDPTCWPAWICSSMRGMR